MVLVVERIVEAADYDIVDWISRTTSSCFVLPHAARSLDPHQNINCPLWEQDDDLIAARRLAYPIVRRLWRLPGPFVIRPPCGNASPAIFW